MNSLRTLVSLARAVIEDCRLPGQNLDFESEALTGFWVSSLGGCAGVPAKNGCSRLGMQGGHPLNKPHFNQFGFGIGQGFRRGLDSWSSRAELRSIV